MNIIERQQARSLMKQAEMAKNPFMERQLKRMQSKVVEEKKSMEILNSYGPNGYIQPKPKESKPPKKSDEQLIMESILDQF
jgi:hypothetical protein